MRSLIDRFNHEAGRQTVVLYAAQLASSGLNFLFTVVIGRAMAQEEYGIFSFCAFSIIYFLGLLFDFGVFSAGTRLLAVATDRDDERRMLGTLFLAGFGIAALFAVTIAASGPVVDVVMVRLGYPDTQVARLLLAASPLAAAVPLQLLVEFACQGTNRIGALAAQRLALPIASITFIGALSAFAGPISPLLALLAYQGGILTATAILIVALRPSFRVSRADFALLGAAIREYGFDLYLGRVVGMMSLRIDLLLIPGFVGPRRFGAYNIAQRVSEPISGLARAMATTRFKAFASLDHVGSSIVRWNIALLSAAAVGLASVGPFFIAFAFQGKYHNALPLLFPFAYVALFAGLLQPYNMFLTAHGRGKDLRNIALIMSLVNLFGLFAFVRTYGLPGAAWFAASSMAFNFVLHLYYYRRLRAGLAARVEDRHEHDDD